MLAGVADCRRSQKWAAKEDGNWDLNLGPAAIEGRDYAASKSGEDHKVLGEKRRKRPRGSKVNRE